MKHLVIAGLLSFGLLASSRAAAFDDGTPQEYHPFSGGAPVVLHQFKGTHVELLLPDSWLPENGGLTAEQRRVLLDRADILYQYYTELLGWEPLPPEGRVNIGLMRMAVVPLSGINGLAPFGRKEMEINDGALDIFRDGLLAGFETQRSIMIHEMGHAFDLYPYYLRYDDSCNSGDPPNWCHAWTNFFDGYIPFYGRMRGIREDFLLGDRTGEAHEAFWTDHTYRPYYDALSDFGVNWTTCILTEGCLPDITARDTWAGLTHRWAELYGVEGVQRAMAWLADYAAANPDPVLSPEAGAYRHVLMLAAGAQENMSCFLEEWKWFTSAALEAEMAALYGTVNAKCLDYDLDGYSPLQGDCRDSNPGVYPGAPEEVNGLDDDCNRHVDDLTPPPAPVVPIGHWGEVFTPEKDGVDFVLRSSTLTLDAPIVAETPSWIRFWVTGHGLVGYVPYSAEASLNWTPLSDTGAGTYGYRAQLMSDTKPLSDWTDVEWFEYAGPCTTDLECDDGDAFTIDDCMPSNLCSNVGLGLSVYEAEEMTHSTGNAYAGGWNLHSNGYAELIHDFAGGWQYVTVTAAGQYAYGSWPHLRVTVGGGQVFETFVEFPSWTEYSFWVNRPPGVAPVRVYFTNDYYYDPPGPAPAVDRNLLLESVIVYEPGGPGSPASSVNLGAVNAETTYTVDGPRELVIDQLAFTWTPAHIVVGFGQTDGQSLSGVSVSVNGGAAVGLSGNWQTLTIPYTGPSPIHLTVYTSTARGLRTQWWAQG